MNKDTLVKMGLTEEQAGKVMEMLDGSFVTKDRFNEVNTELKQARDAVKERDGQIASLKNSTGDAEALQATITQLQADNKAKDDAHAAEIKQLKVDAALEKALVSAKARNAATVRPLLDLDKAELQDDGTIKGLSEQLKKLTTADDTKFLFDTVAEGTPKLKGIAPAQGKDGLPGDGDTWNPDGAATVKLNGMFKQF